MAHERQALVSAVVGVLLAPVFVVGCATTVAPEALQVTLDVENRIVDSEAHPTVRVRYENRSHRPIAFSHTFGAAGFIYLTIESVSGDVIGLPIEVDLFRLPKYRCLRPGESIEMEMDLLEWNLLIGGEKQPYDSYSFRLTPGQYRIRANYEEIRQKARCAVINGIARSNWVEFEY